MYQVIAPLALLSIVYTTAPAQDSVPPRPDSTRTDSAAPVPPPPPTAAQQRYLQGLRTAGRGIAQLKTGVDRVNRASRDSLQQRQAGRFLGGLCGTARGYMASGRAQMLPTVYEPPTRLAARQLAQRIDSLIAFAGSCERTAGRAPTPAVTALVERLRAYETALATFRTAIGLPSGRPDTATKTPRR